MTAGANRQLARPRRAHDDAVPAPARPGSGDPDRWTRLSAAAAGERGAQPRRICQLCVQTLGVTGAGICLVTDTGNRGVVCASDDVSGQIEDLQFTLGEGPCIEAVRTGAPVLVADLDEPPDIVVERWPTFLEGAGAAGVRAVFAFPLRIGAITLGALDLYRDRPGDLDGVPPVVLWLGTVVGSWPVGQSGSGAGVTERGPSFAEQNPAVMAGQEGCRVVHLHLPTSGAGLAGVGGRAAARYVGAGEG